jgi:GNAT superfamily N-acetyltransferase
MVAIAPADPGSADARWCLSHYFADLAARFDFDPARTLPTAPGDLFLLARFGGQPAGCGVLKALDERTGEILRMWVDRPHRGLGIAGRLLEALETAAAQRGHERVCLYTNRSLDEAKALYRARGYREIPRYNDDPFADHWFEKRLSSSSTERA